MKVIGVQMDIVWENKMSNFDTVQALLKKAQPNCNDMIVLPEMFSTGFSMDVNKICETDTKETESFLHSLASKYQCYIVGGLVTRSSQEQGYNEAIVFHPQGETMARYRKMHPFSLAGENIHYLPGDAITTFLWNDITVSPFICYDLRFPEIFRHSVYLGTEMMVVIANWPDLREDHWNTLLKARAIENQAYVVGVNRCGCDPKFTYSGKTQIIDPKGTVLADAGSRETAITAEIDRQQLLEYRNEFPVLDDIRKEYTRFPPS